MGEIISVLLGILVVHIKDSIQEIWNKVLQYIRETFGKRPSVVKLSQSIFIVIAGKLVCSQDSYKSTHKKPQTVMDNNKTTGHSLQSGSVGDPLVGMLSIFQMGQ